VAFGSLRASAQEGNAALPIDVEVTGVIEAPPADVRAVLLDLERFHGWFPAIGEWRVLDRPGGDVARVYGRQALPWPLSDRDYVVEYRWVEEDGVFHLVATALDDAEPAPPKGVVRVVEMRTEWEIVAAPGGTSVRYRYEGDTGGRIPKWAVRAMRSGWRSRASVVIDQLRAEVLRRDAEVHDDEGSPDEEESR